jgi:hypothetical protein
MHVNQFTCAAPEHEEEAPQFGSPVEASSEPTPPAPSESRPLHLPGQRPYLCLTVSACSCFVLTRLQVRDSERDEEETKHNRAVRSCRPELVAACPAQEATTAVAERRRRRRRLEDRARNASVAAYGPERVRAGQPRPLPRRRPARPGGRPRWRRHGRARRRPPPARRPRRVRAPHRSCLARPFLCPPWNTDFAVLVSVPWFLSGFAFIFNFPGRAVDAMRFELLRPIWLVPPADDRICLDFRS